MNSASTLSNSLIGFHVCKSDCDAMLLLLIAAVTNKQVHSNERKTSGRVTWLGLRMSKGKQK